MAGSVVVPDLEITFTEKSLSETYSYQVCKISRWDRVSSIKDLWSFAFFFCLQVCKMMAQEVNGCFGSKVWPTGYRSRPKHRCLIWFVQQLSRCEQILLCHSFLEGPSQPQKSLPAPVPLRNQFICCRNLCLHIVHFMWCNKFVQERLSNQIEYVSL